jgi:hypothetical protein
MNRELMTCNVSWCGNKCDLYGRKVEGLLFIQISSLEVNGHCPYRPSLQYKVTQEVKYEFTISNDTQSEK